MIPTPREWRPCDRGTVSLDLTTVMLAVLLVILILVLVGRL